MTEKSHTARVLSLTFDESGQWLASGDEQGVISLWKVDDDRPQLAAKWQHHKAGVRSLTFTPEASASKALASASEDGTVRIWNVEGLSKLEKTNVSTEMANREIILSDHDDWVRAVAFAPERPILASAGEDGKILLYEWTTWSLTEKPRRTSVLTGHQGAVTAVSFSDDGRTLASAGIDQIVRIWDPQEGHPLLALPGHLSAVRSIAFVAAGNESKGNALASFDEGGILKFWIGTAAKDKSALVQTKVHN
jgi:WD40 repeat protein